jgi:hypothetical protein
MNTPDYHQGAEQRTGNFGKNGITYLPVCYCMFYQREFIKD